MASDDRSKLPPDLEDGDRLFDTGSRSLYTVRLEWDFLHEYRYVDGFQRAADVLSQHVLAHRHDTDVLGMPILFCYRHWMELRLKDLWLLGAQLRHEDVDPRRTHDLRELWRLVRPSLEAAWPTEPRETLDWLEVVIHELADADGPKAEGFRYANDQAGDVTLPSTLTIDIANVHAVMAKVARVLDGAAIAFEEWLSHERDAMAEYRDDSY